jgi:hypothetical protein
MGSDDDKTPGDCSSKFVKVIPWRKPLAARDFPLDHQKAPAMIPPLIRPETA